jgi:hypothetical protein
LIRRGRFKEKEEAAAEAVLLLGLVDLVVVGSMLVVPVLRGL